LINAAKLCHDLQDIKLITAMTLNLTRWCQYIQRIWLLSSDMW